jgi:DNA-3-methyladenine glycosylase I
MSLPPSAEAEWVAMTAPAGPIRCAWAEGGSEQMQRYHDLEWGVPSHDDRHLFEMLVLEGAQAGLSWSTILHKREGYRRAFAGFDAARVARFDQRRIERLLSDPGIVRNRAKVEATMANARAVVEVQHEEESLMRICGGWSVGEPCGTGGGRWPRSPPRRMPPGP